MGTTTYTSFETTTLHEDRDGVERDYLGDSLSSTAGLLNSSQVKAAEFWYWPYGSLRASTGSSNSRFLFVGQLGYVSDTTTRYYVRSRGLNADLASWMQVDPIWPREPAYCYVNCMPSYQVDPLGLAMDIINCPPSVVNWLNKLCFNIRNLDARGAAEVDRCIKKEGGHHGLQCGEFSGDTQQRMMKFCGNGRVECFPRDIPGQPGNSGYTPLWGICQLSLSNAGSPYTDTFYDWTARGNGGQPIRLDWLALSFLHEMGHSTGVGHAGAAPWGVGAAQRDQECNDIFAYCIYRTFWNKNH